MKRTVKREVVEWIAALMLNAVFWTAMFWAVAIAYPAP